MPELTCANCQTDAGGWYEAQPDGSWLCGECADQHRANMAEAARA